MDEHSDSAQESEVELLPAIPPSPLALYLRGLQQKIFGNDRSIAALLVMLTAGISFVVAYGAQYIGNRPALVTVGPRDPITIDTFVDDADTEPTPELFGKMGDGVPPGTNAPSGEISVSLDSAVDADLDKRQSADVTNQLSNIAKTGEEIETSEYDNEVDPNGTTPGPGNSPKEGPHIKCRFPSGGRSPELRWSIVYAGNQTLEQYAKTLDEFNIELGVSRQGVLKVLTSLTGLKPQSRNAPANDNRLYFRWQDEGRKKADKELAKLAGITGENVIIVHYIPKSLEQTFRDLEAQAAKAQNVSIDQIKRTKFGIQKIGNHREFYVMALEK